MGFSKQLTQSCGTKMKHS